MMKKKILNWARKHATFGEKVVIFDLDSTLCNVTHRVHHAHARRWDAFNAACVSDLPRYQEVALLKKFYNTHHPVLIITGRSEVYRADTEWWLGKYGIPYDRLLMRPADDARSDHVVKWDLFLRTGYNKHDVLCVVEDRDRVVDMWRENGLLCLQNIRGAY